MNPLAAIVAEARKILDEKGLSDAHIHIDCCLPAKLRIKLACRYARQVEHLMPRESRDALEVFERYADGGASEDALKEAAAATATPVYASRAAARAAYADTEAVYASRAARCTTYATNSAAYANTTQAAYAARAAWYTATAYARAEEKVIYAKQVQILREFLTQMEGGAA